MFSEIRKLGSRQYNGHMLPPMPGPPAAIRQKKRSFAALISTVPPWPYARKSGALDKNHCPTMSCKIGLVPIGLEFLKYPSQMHLMIQFIKNPGLVYHPGFPHACKGIKSL